MKSFTLVTATISLLTLTSALPTPSASSTTLTERFSLFLDTASAEARDVPDSMKMVQNLSLFLSNRGAAHGDSAEESESVGEVVLGNAEDVDVVRGERSMRFRKA